MRKSLLLLIFLSCFAVFGWFGESFAQLRLLPQNGERGVTGEKLPLPMVVISRKPMKLAPGGLIFDTNNRTILHQDLPPGAEVWYQKNIDGDVQRIYLLSAFEQARLDQQKK